MKIAIRVPCSSCGNEFPAVGYGEKAFPAAVCPKCGSSIHIFDPLSISVLADRLLYRSKAEMEGADYTLSIICSAIAVECALTQVFLKWKAIESRKIPVQSATDAEREAWENEYKREPKSSGHRLRNFSMSANFVSKFLSGKAFNDFASDFVKASGKGKLIKFGFPPYASQLRVEYTQKELFDRRNRIMHWADVDYKKEDAAASWFAASWFIGILKAMDREKYEANERKWRNSLAGSQNSP
jgi:hypothetical protein